MNTNKGNLIKKIEGNKELNDFKLLYNIKQMSIPHELILVVFKKVEKNRKLKTKITKKNTEGRVLKDDIIKNKK